MDCCFPLPGCREAYAAARRSLPWRCRDHRAPHPLWYTKYTALVCLSLLSFCLSLSSLFSKCFCFMCTAPYPAPESRTWLSLPPCLLFPCFVSPDVSLCSPLSVIRLSFSIHWAQIYSGCGSHRLCLVLHTIVVPCVLHPSPLPRQGPGSTPKTTCGSLPSTALWPLVVR